jgi:cytochrome c biogenesis protein CcdA
VAALIALALSVGIVDSINPSTVGPAVYLASRPRAVRSLASFTAGVFAVYAAGGIVLALGPGEALPHPAHHLVNLLEVCFGAGAILLAAALWLARERVAARLKRRRGTSGTRAPFLLGAGIMAVELPTAFPYFAVIAAVVASGRSVATEVSVLLVFNAAFVAPLVAILAVRALAGERGELILRSWRLRIERHGAVLAPAVVFAIGIVLVALGLT